MPPGKWILAVSGAARGAGAHGGGGRVKGRVGGHAVAGGGAKGHARGILVEPHPSPDVVW